MNSTTSAAPAKSFTRFFPVIARILLGFVFFAGGLAYFLLPPPTSPMPEGATAFMGAMMKTGYLMTFLKLTETLAGALLLANRFVPLALAVLAPIVINITAFIAFLMPTGLPIAVMLVALEGYLAWAYRDAYLPMLRWQTPPGGGCNAK
jgi:uncharacterized membrane protein YphA (DoxX/SURF4 family)